MSFIHREPFRGGELLEPAVDVDESDGEVIGSVAPLAQEEDPVASRSRSARSGVRARCFSHSREA